MRTVKQAAKHCVQINSTMDMEKYLKEYANDIIDMCASQAEYVMEPEEVSNTVIEAILQIKKSI